MTIEKLAHDMKMASPRVASTSVEERNEILEAIKIKLSENKEIIFDSNKLDLERALENNIPESVKSRIKFDEGKLEACISGIDQLLNLEDPLGKELLRRELDDDLLLVKETVPLGVIAVIFEARPDALVQVSTLCIKSGNCAILKGGSEASETNQTLFRLIFEAATQAGLNEKALALVQSHAEISELLTCEESIDLIIPRGSNKFVQYIMNNTKIPVMGHADGICHIFVDESANQEMAIPLIVDAKTQYPSACNTVETVLIHSGVSENFVKDLVEGLRDANVKVKGCPRIRAIVEDVIETTEEDFHTEYTDYIINIKMLDSIDEAIDHINYYGSGHTESILTENMENRDIFMSLVDAAGVYHNCSTRFADGFRYGFGAEVGVSTGKLHARGPVGLEGLVTYKYKVFGNGNIVGDYASGKRQFTHKDIK